MNVWLDWHERLPWVLIGVGVLLILVAFLGVSPSASNLDTLWGLLAFVGIALGVVGVAALVVHPRKK